ncbi:Stress responsive alpha-beta barrel [Trichodesmium erythraeum IMS101]|uniref:Stress responsive alpha-beta barrel n=1 Tax=Trichodesmium erythraeum (strain IMS101) TaxID=203124 RepID=Q118F6_TRIEI|nr:Dabb family protein [Trichodesmium erythraeum GBRTRLIN201]MCH2049370.1 Dabb family protein [Trichodesmium sp. ALOHA_ZT_67]MDE5095964.1 Dabb family protein [Trichodesmium sp. St11_bin5]MDT9340901.1 Dabb family protein [Trichodesmium erythraeum 21-75]
MIVHIVLFKWNSDTSTETIASVMSALRGMKGKVPEIIDLSCGDNFSELSQGFQNGLVVQVKDKAALDAYAKNSIHQQIIQTLIKPILADKITIDYEV